MTATKLVLTVVIGLFYMASNTSIAGFSAAAMDEQNTAKLSTAFSSGELAYFRSLFGELKSADPSDPKLVALGKKLFHDPVLSSKGTISCASCHILENGGDDDIAVSVGVSGKPLPRNSPTVYNLSGHLGYFWDGRVNTLEEQIDGPIEHPDEMDSDWGSVVQKISADAEYLQEFADVFQDVPSEQNIKQAIISFEKRLITNESPFDHFLRGDDKALSETALNGLARFVNLGCVSCHQGPLLGGNLLQVFGVYEEYPHGEPQDTLFKVPTLRNIAHTAPYFHNGQARDLAEAVQIMSRVQLGYDLSDIERTELLIFLGSLSDPRVTNGDVEGIIGQ